MSLSRLINSAFSVTRLTVISPVTIIFEIVGGTSEPPVLVFEATKMKISYSPKLPDGNYQVTNIHGKELIGKIFPKGIERKQFFTVQRRSFSQLNPEKAVHFLLGAFRRLK